MKLNTFACIISSAFLLAACNSNEISDSKDVTQEKIYQHYIINYKEGEEKAEVFTQFRFGGETGTTLVLNKPSIIKLDDETIKVDSNSATGAFYRLNKPVDSFYGKHILEFTDINSKVVKNEFDFEKFSITTPAAAVSRKKPLYLKFAVPLLKADDRIEISASETDSTFKIIHTANDSTSFIMIPANELARQKQKQLSLEAALFRTLSLQQNSGGGGIIEMKYALKPLIITFKD